MPFFPVTLAFGLGFFLAALQPLQAASGGQASLAKEGPLVVLDAGHGGEETGVRIGDFSEAAFTLDLAKRVSKQLLARGIRSELTRDDNRGISLTARASLANSLEAACFVSLHANFSFTPASKGPRVFISAARLPATALPDPRSGKSLIFSRWSQSQAPVAEDSRRLGLAIARELSGGSGVQALRLAQFKGLQMPAALVECGFATQENELEKLKSSQEQDDLAERISRGVQKFLASRSSAQP